MISVDKCIICGSKNLKRYDAQCAPFLAERTWNSESFALELLYCKNCDFSFYNPRPEDEELGRLYQGYRDAQYQKQREKFEEYYTKEFNESLGNNKKEIDARKLILSSIIKEQMDIKNIRSVLDYGGDKGQFFTEEFDTADKYVYDISNVSPLPGIKRIFDIDNNDDKKFDFIICCNVLEHVPDPHEIIDRIIRFSHGGTKFYFELPVDSPLNNKSFFVKFYSSHRKISKFYSKMRHHPWIVFFNMHEHINHFSIRSLKKLLELHGLNVEYIEIRKVHLSAADELLCCYATKTI